MYLATHLGQSVMNNLMRFVCVLKEGLRLNWLNFVWLLHLINIKCMTELQVGT